MNLESIKKQITDLLNNKTNPEKIEVLNDLRVHLKQLSPQVEPVDTVLWVKLENVQANEYNPNTVAPVELDLLYTSVKSDGYTMPVVCYALGGDKYEIVDGFHRFKTLSNHEDLKKRTHGYLPITVIDKPLDERMGSTIRHNRARGNHQIKSMSEIVLDLLRSGWDDRKICEKLGMDQEEVLRLKQISGLKEAFANHEFSKSWEDFETKTFPEEVGDVGKTVSKKPVRKNAQSS
jgi:ParB-like chromosome segregation protein Spo0J